MMRRGLKMLLAAGVTLAGAIVLLGVLSALASPPASAQDSVNVCVKKVLTPEADAVSDVGDFQVQIDAQVPQGFVAPPPDGCFDSDLSSAYAQFTITSGEQFVLREIIPDGVAVTPAFACNSSDNGLSGGVDLDDGDTDPTSFTATTDTADNLLLCTITNDVVPMMSVCVQKEVLESIVPTPQNPLPADFAVTLTAGAATMVGPQPFDRSSCNNVTIFVGGGTGWTEFLLPPGEAFTLTETGPSNFAPAAITCRENLPVFGDGPIDATVDLSAGSISVTPTATQTDVLCTFTNTQTLVCVIKLVGPVAHTTLGVEATDFTITAPGTTEITALTENDLCGLGQVTATPGFSIASTAFVAPVGALTITEQPAPGAATLTANTAILLDPDAAELPDGVEDLVCVNLLQLFDGGVVDPDTIFVGASSPNSITLDVPASPLVICALYNETVPICVYKQLGAAATARGDSPSDFNFTATTDGQPTNAIPFTDPNVAALCAISADPAALAPLGAAMVKPGLGFEVTEQIPTGLENVVGPVPTATPCAQAGVQFSDLSGAVLTGTAPVPPVLQSVAGIDGISIGGGSFTIVPAPASGGNTITIADDQGDQVEVTEDTRVTCVYTNDTVRVCVAKLVGATAASLGYLPGDFAMSTTAGVRTDPQPSSESLADTCDPNDAFAGAGWTEFFVAPGTDFTLTEAIPADAPVGLLPTGEPVCTIAGAPRNTLVATADYAAGSISTTAPASPNGAPLTCVFFNDTMRVCADKFVATNAFGNGAAPADFSVTITANGTTDTKAFEATDECDGQVSAAEFGYTFFDLAPGTPFTLAEVVDATEPSGPVFIECSITRVAGDVVVPGDLATASVAVTPEVIDTRVDCEFANDTVEVRINKVVQNRNGGSAVSDDFAFDVYVDSSLVLTGADTDPGAAALSVFARPGSQVRIVEKQRVGYRSASVECDIAGATATALDNPQVEFTAPITSGAAGIVTCEFINDDLPAVPVCITKTINDNDRYDTDNFTFEVYDANGVLVGTKASSATSDPECTGGGTLITSVFPGGTSYSVVVVSPDDARLRLDAFSCNVESAMTSRAALTIASAQAAAASTVSFVPDSSTTAITCVSASTFLPVDTPVLPPASADEPVFTTISQPVTEDEVLDTVTTQPPLVATGSETKPLLTAAVVAVAMGFYAMGIGRMRHKPLD